MLDRLAGLIAPHNCLGCRAEGALLCGQCGAGLLRVPERCYRCRRLSSASRTCRRCRSSSPLRTVHVARVYEGLARQLVWGLKFSGARAAAAEMSGYLLPLLDKLSLEGAVLVPVPTATRRVRRRGYDQAKLLARELARHSGCRRQHWLARQGQAHQVGATRTLRKAQMKQAFRVKKPLAVRGASIILVDDVLTTGATLEEAARCLRLAGARHVDALVFAQA